MQKFRVVISDVNYSEPENPYSCHAMINAISKNDIFIETNITVNKVREFDFIKYDSVYNIRLTPSNTQNTIDYVWMLNDQIIPVTYENNSYVLPFVKHKPFHVLKCIYTGSKIKFGGEFDLTFDCMYYSNHIYRKIRNEETITYEYDNFKLKYDADGMVKYLSNCKQEDENSLKEQLEYSIREVNRQSKIYGHPCYNINISSVEDMCSKHSNSVLEAISNIFSPPKTIEERLEDLENKLDRLLLNLKK